MNSAWFVFRQVSDWNGAVDGDNVVNGALSCHRAVWSGNRRGRGNGDPVGPVGAMDQFTFEPPAPPGIGAIEGPFNRLEQRITLPAGCDVR